MKIFDKVKILCDRPEYLESNVHKGEIGTIWSAEIRDNSFEVIFDNHDENEWYKYAIVDIKDMEVVEDGKATNEMILDALPKNNPNWWCKVEDGYILNLKGERKNKVPYDYDS